MSDRPSPDCPCQAAALVLPRGGALIWKRVVPADVPALPPAIRTCAPRRRDGFAAGRAAARAALAAAGYRGEAPLDAGHGGVPRWPAGWRGSISHTNDWAAAVAAPADACAVLGFDMERPIDPATAADIAALVMPESAPGGSGMAPELEVTRAFSAKEALYKALFPVTGEFREFTAARVGWSGPRLSAWPEARLTLAEDWGPDWPCGMVFPIRQAVARGLLLSLVWV